MKAGGPHYRLSAAWQQMPTDQRHLHKSHGRAHFT